MFSKLKLSLSRINYKLFAALLVLGLAPTVYNTVRVFFLGQLPGEWSFSIAGQLSWVNLIYEIINETIILPLFYFIGKVKDDKKAFSNRVRTGMLLSLGIYAVLSAVIMIFAEPLLNLMATDTSIIDASASYIRIESIANVFSILTQFALVALVTVNKSKYLYALTGARLVLCLVSDTFLVSTLPVSANLGVNGIGYSNIIVNALLLLVSLVLLAKEGIKVFGKAKLNFVWTKEFAKVGGISGVESNLGTAIRTGVVLVMAWIIVFARGKQAGLKKLDKKELVFISLSGLATGASWLCYYYAIQNGDVSIVVPIDKLSIIVTVIFSYFVFKEKLSKKAFLGLALMVAGTLLMAFFK